MLLECGSEIPKCLYTYIVKPEQSKPEGEDPAHTYGVPRNVRAYVTTSSPVVPPPEDGASVVVVVFLVVVVCLTVVVVVLPVVPVFPP
jgi:hypothetical protein